MWKTKTPSLSLEDQERLRRLIRSRGLAGVARTLRMSRQAVLTLACGAPAHAATVALGVERLPALEAEFADKSTSRPPPAAA